MPAFGVFHVTSRGVERRPIFIDDPDRETFLMLVEIAERVYRWRTLAYCLLSNHFHLVVTTTLGGLSNGMQMVTGRYAQIFNHRHERTGHLFQGRFHARPVTDDVYLATVCDYVLDNALRAGLCETRGEWPWLGGELARA